MTPWLLLVPVALFAIAFALRRSLTRRKLVAIGIAFAAFGLGCVALLEWRYAARNTTPLTVPVDLARAGEIATPDFHPAIAGPYDLWLEFDHGDDTEDFYCWVGADGMEAACPKADPLLDVAWTVREDGAAIAHGGSDSSRWHAKQAALDPAAAARARASFLDYQHKSTDPANRWPLFASIGRFRAQQDRDYDITLVVAKPVNRLAALHPKLVIGLAASATRGLGRLVMGFAILWVLAGATLALLGVKRGAES